jgi:hypothetical protein
MMNMSKTTKVRGLGKIRTKKYTHNEAAMMFQETSFETKKIHFGDLAPTKTKRITKGPETAKHSGREPGITSDNRPATQHQVQSGFNSWTGWGK